MTSYDAVRFVDERTGKVGPLAKALRYVFPEHWSFLLGEIALYAFLVLLGSGVYLALFFEPHTGLTVYDGSYVPLQGREVTFAYNSVVDLSFDVRGGLLARQTHHWAANVFVAAIVLHLLRVFFTGAYRKPRDLIYYVGVLMLALAMLEGFLGYSLLDDLLSGMGLQIAYSVLFSVPVVGDNLGLMVWGGEFPGGDAFWSRMYLGHVLLLPIAIATLIGLHLALLTMSHHSQFPGGRRTSRNVVGAPMWPSYALRSLGLMLGVAAVLVGLGAFVQINPIWEWGPFETYLSTNGAQPDWYMGWLIGALRLMPSLEVTIGDYTLVPNAFFGGVLFPTLMFAFLFAWPSLERRLTRDERRHHLLDRPRDAPLRTAIGLAVLSVPALTLFAGAADRVEVQTGISYTAQIWVYRVLLFVLPPVIFFLTLRICRELRSQELHPILGEHGEPAEEIALGPPERAEMTSTPGRPE